MGGLGSEVSGLKAKRLEVSRPKYFETLTSLNSTCVLFQQTSRYRIAQPQHIKNTDFALRTFNKIALASALI